MERNMVERAKQELEMLETLHPDRFDYLKLELKSFISLLQSQQLQLDPLPTTSTATTQASTSMKRKRRERGNARFRYDDNNTSSRSNCKKVVKKKIDRVDVVLEKAQACLRKIQDFKISLF